MEIREEREVEVLSCPFCGSGELCLIDAHHSSWITCENCKAEGPEGETQAGAVDGWNNTKERKVADV